MTLCIFCVQRVIFISDQLFYLDKIKKALYFNCLKVPRLSYCTYNSVLSVNQTALVTFPERRHLEHT